MREKATDRPWLKDNSLADARWEPWMSRFQGTPTYFFEGLPFPSSIKEAKQQISVLQAELVSIQSKIREYENAADIAADSNERRSLALESKERAIRAERMRTSQIKIIEAWISDQGADFEAEILRLDKEVRSLHNILLFILERINIEESDFIALMSNLKS